MAAACDKVIHLRNRDSRQLVRYHRRMDTSDPYLTRIQTFNRARGGGITITRVRDGYNLHLTATQAPVARLQPNGSGDRMRIKYWSYLKRWQDVGDMGGLVLPLDQALEEIAKNEIFWMWT